MTALLRAALSGAATGGRSCTGLAALTLATPSRPISQPDRTLSQGWAKGVAVLLAAGEIGADKLPQAPSRLEPPGLAFRCLAGAAVGLIIARRTPEAAGETVTAGAGDSAIDRAEAVSPPVPGLARTAACVVVATAAAAGTSWLGATWRGWAAGRFGHDYPGAVLEDVVTVALAGLSVRV